MAFNLKRFLRAAPLSALRLYFQAVGIAILAAHEGTDVTKTKVDALADTIHALPIQRRTRVITDFEHVDRLCNPAGQRSLFSVIPFDSPIRAMLQAAECNEARCLILLGQQDGLFEHALCAAYADGQRNGRSWSGFAIDSDAITGAKPPNWPAFKLHLAGILTRPDGTTGRLHVDSFERSDVDENGNPAGTTVHHAIYSEALPVSEFEYQGDVLTREIRRPADPGAILYDADARTIDVMVGGGETIRRKVADSFADNILATKGKIHPVTRRHLDLERLRQPQAFATDPADGIKVVKLTSLRFARIGVPFERVTIEVDPTDTVDIYTRSARSFGDRNPLLWPEWQVTYGVFRILFHSESARAGEIAISIELRRPNGLTVRDQTRRHQIILQKYLTRWGILL